MLQIDLTQQEKMVLRKILDEYYSELKMEISNTENWELKDKLKTEETVIKKVLAEA